MAGPTVVACVPPTDLQRTVAPFKVVSDFQPPATSRRPSPTSRPRIKAGEKDIVLLGATGTGKSATTAWLIEQVQRPTLVMAPNKTLAAQLANEFRELLPNNAVEYFVSLLRLLPARGLRPADGHLHREGLLDQRRGRAAAALRDQLAAHPPRRHRGRRRCPASTAWAPRRSTSTGWSRLRVGDGDRPRRAAAPVRPDAVHPQRPGVHPRHVPGPRRHASRSSRSTRSSPSASSSSATRSSGSTRCTRSPARSCTRSRRCTSSRPPTTSPAPSGWSGRSAASSSSSPTSSRRSRSRASCSRRSGCACAPPTTSR